MTEALLRKTGEIPTEKSEQTRYLRKVYEDHGYVRVKIDRRLGGKRTGWEVRLSLPTRQEAETVRKLLRRVGLRCGTLFPKHSRFVVPIYGRRQVELFLARLKPDRKNSIPKRFVD